MKNRLLVFMLLAVAALLKFAPICPASDSGLIGTWLCKTDMGEIKLEILNESRLVFDGDGAGYSLKPGIILVNSDEGTIEYPYQLKEGSLLITFPEGIQLSFKRTAAKSQPPNAQQKTPESATANGKEALLTGMLCSWGGSSSSSSSYSHTMRVSFDGRGRFTYGGESSFSSEAGMAYSGGSTPSQGGTYRISGDTVHLTFNDGTSGTASVHMRQNNGRITELMYEGTLYATGLCD
jgi:hypothetical protein